SVPTVSPWQIPPFLHLVNPSSSPKKSTRSESGNYKSLGKNTRVSPPFESRLLESATYKPLLLPPVCIVINARRMPHSFSAAQLALRHACSTLFVRAAPRPAQYQSPWTNEYLPPTPRSPTSPMAPLFSSAASASAASPSTSSTPSAAKAP